MEAMFKAVSEGDESAMMALLNADPMLLEKSDRDRMRPLAVAAQHGQLGALRLLVKEGAEISARNQMNYTALQWAAVRGHTEVVAFLLGQGAQADVKDLRLACARGHVGLVRLLGQHMGTLALDEEDGYGNTGLHLAVDGGRTEVVNFLISQGADANRLFSDGTTLLMRASANGHMGVVRALLQHMGTLALHETDEDGKTALHWAVHEGWGQERMVRFLLVAGADSSIMDHELMTPRAVAEENEYAEIVAVFEWWESGLQRRYLVSRATRLHKAFITQRDAPTSQVPTYLEARVAAGREVPVVEVVPRPPHAQWKKKEEHAGTSGKRKAVGGRGDSEEAESVHAMVEEEATDAVVEYVVKALNEELLFELLEAFQPEK